VAAELGDNASGMEIADEIRAFDVPDFGLRAAAAGCGGVRRGAAGRREGGRRRQQFVKRPTLSR
jgi:hypothetical protein